MSPNSTTKVKCVVWDLDDTLWEGILAEGGAAELRPGVAELLKTLDQRGVLHSIASKNEATRARARLSELGVAHYFVISQISWQPKSSLVASIAKRLNIGLDTVVFIDDSPFERAEVTDAYPEVRCVDGQDLTDLADRPEFDVPVTAEAAARRHLYQEAETRREYEESFEGPRSLFLASLDMKLTVRPATPQDLLRAAELTERTHQLNTTGLVFSAAQLAESMTRPDQILLVAALTDRFGDYGTVGVILLDANAAQWRIRLFLMSCRVMGRNIGGAMLAFLAREADARRVDLTADFLANDVNRPMYVVYRLAGFEELERHGDVQRLRLRAAAGRVIPDYVDLHARLGAACP
jgi:FkbH-like protein